MDLREREIGQRHFHVHGGGEKSILGQGELKVAQLCPTLCDLMD